MNKSTSFTNLIVMLTTVFSVVGCEDPVEAVEKGLRLEISGSKPFYFEGAWYNYDKKFVVDSTNSNGYGADIELKESAYLPSGSSLRVYAKCQDSGGHVIASVVLTHPKNWNDVQVDFHQTKESYGGAVEITCTVP